MSDGRRKAMQPQIDEQAAMRASMEERARISREIREGLKRMRAAQAPRVRDGEAVPVVDVKGKKRGRRG